MHYFSNETSNVSREQATKSNIYKVFNVIFNINKKFDSSINFNSKGK